MDTAGSGTPRRDGKTKQMSGPKSRWRGFFAKIESNENRQEIDGTYLAQRYCGYAGCSVIRWGGTTESSGLSRSTGSCRTISTGSSHACSAGFIPYDWAASITVLTAKSAATTASCETVILTPFRTKNLRDMLAVVAAMMML